MKHILSLVFVVFVSIIASAQPTEFYGLKLGQQYTKKEIIKAVGKNGKFIKQDDSTSEVEFKSITYEGNEYDYGNFNIFPDGSLFSFAVGYTTSENVTVQQLESVYNSLKEHFFSKYNDIDWYPSDDEKGTISYTYIGGEAMINLLYSHPAQESASILITYANSQILSQLLQYSTEVTKPTIQDTFIGLKLGDVATTIQVEKAVGGKGIFLETQRGSNYIEYTYKDFYFAGVKWDRAVISTDSSHRFFKFQVYNSFFDESFNQDERREAKEQYEYLKEKLNAKYGEYYASIDERTDENGNMKIYYHGNNIVAIISNERAKSVGGSYRRYVILEYVQTEILNSIAQANNDEF